jgi:hypothetical protein
MKISAVTSVRLIHLGTGRVYKYVMVRLGTFDTFWYVGMPRRIFCMKLYLDMGILISRFLNPKLKAFTFNPIECPSKKENDIS